MRRTHFLAIIGLICFTQVNGWAQLQWWGDAYNMVDYPNCNWITNAEPPQEQDNSSQKNAEYVSAVMIMAGAGWCCHSSGPPENNGCDHNSDGTQDVNPDNDYFQNTNCRDQNDQLWDVMTSPATIRNGLGYAAGNPDRWRHVDGVPDYFQGSQWETGGGSDPGDLAAVRDLVTMGVEDSGARVFIIFVKTNGISYSCESMGDSTNDSIENFIYYNNSCQLYRATPLGANASDAKRFMHFMRKGQGK